jgi:hypothetical protein
VAVLAGDFVAQPAAESSANPQIKRKIKGERVRIRDQNIALNVPV